MLKQNETHAIKKAIIDLYLFCRTNLKHEVLIHTLLVNQQIKGNHFS